MGNEVREPVDEEPPPLADVPELAAAAYGAGELDRTIELWEDAYTRLRSADQPVPAAGAAVRVAMHLLFDTALLAPVRGWLARADELLAGHDPTPAHAWLAVVRSYERLLAGDQPGARRSAVQAIEIGTACEPAACAIGRVADARLRILDGDVDDGLALLDAAGGAAVSGELDPLSTGVVYCELVCALQGLAQYDLAEQWTDAMERWSRTNAIGSLHGRCRVHRAEILRLRGQWTDAEAEVEAALEELRPYLHRELGWPLTELGRIRLRKGDVDGAESAYIAAHQAGWESEPGLALVRLTQGNPEAAIELIRDALERPIAVPSKELPPASELRRAPLLDAQVDLELVGGTRERARAAAAELARIAERFHSRALVATALDAEARVLLAEGDAPAAVNLLDDAARHWAAVGAPYETAMTRFRLADGYERQGRSDRATVEREVAQALLDGLDAPTRAARSRPPSATDPRVSTATFRRERDYWTVSFDGTTVHLPDRKGMHHLARLLKHPGTEIHVLDLVAAEAGDASALRHRLGDAGPILDDRAKAAYRRRLAEMDGDIERARAAGDAERETQAETERALLLKELSRAVGLGGGERRAGAASERARAGVTRAVRHAMALLGDAHPRLGAHLERTIRTGTYCAYLPDPRARLTWTG